MSAAVVPSFPSERSTLPTRVRLSSARQERLFFAQVREDPLLEIEALHPGPGETVVVVGSGGCTALSLLARSLARVVAVDRNLVQNHLLELKAAAAARLDSGEAVAFLGAGPREPFARRLTYGTLRADLTAEARAYWDDHPGLVESGALRAGASERFIALVTAVIRRAVHTPARVARLLGCATLADQRRFYETEWDTWRWRALFHLLLNRWCFRRAYDPAFFRHVENPSFARHFHALAQHALTEVPVATNYFLHEMLTGRYPSDRPGGLPPYLDPEGTRALATARARLEVVDGDYTAYLRGCPSGSIHAFALSNICEWLAPPQIDELFAEVVRTAAPGARLCFRNFVGWTAVPEPYQDAITEERGRGEAMMRADRSVVQRRFVVCRVHPRPARIVSRLSRRRSEFAAAHRGGGALRPPRTPEGPSVREATPADNAALVSLAAACPMDGDPALCVHREPDFFALNRLEGSTHRVGVMEARDGSVAGCVALAERRVFLHGRPTQLFYASDLKVHPAHRGHGVADALIRYVRDCAEAAGGPRALVFLTMLTGNRAMEALATGPRGLPRLRRFATLRAHALPLLWRRRERPLAGLRIRTAEVEDLEEMGALWGRVAPFRQFAPVCDPRAFADWIARAPDLEPGSYWLAREVDGRLAGFVAFWDQRRFKQLQVARYSPRLRVVRAALNTLMPLAGAPPLPDAGAPLRNLTATHVCVPAERPDVLRALLRSAYDAHRAGEHSLLNVGLDVRDPLARALAGWLSVPTDVAAYVARVSGDEGGPALDDRPLHYEIALV